MNDRERRRKERKKKKKEEKWTKEKEKKEKKEKEKEIERKVNEEKNEREKVIRFNLRKKENAKIQIVENFVAPFGFRDLAREPHQTLVRIDREPVDLFDLTRRLQILVRQQFPQQLASLSTKWVLRGSVQSNMLEKLLKKKRKKIK